VKVSELTPFESAMAALAKRDVLPTALDTQGLRQLGAGFHRQNFTSAQTLIEDLLTSCKEKVERIINPTTEQRADRVTPENPQGNVTTGLDPATARQQTKELLQQLGYTPKPGEAGTIKDLSSDARTNLVINTNKDVMTGAGQFIQSQDEQVIIAFPAWELFRLTEPRDPRAKRNWTARWQIAAQAAGDFDALRVFAETGRMMARKDSPLWEQLGSSQNFDDGLDNPFPPFAFNSGMEVRDIDFDEAFALGLIKRGERVTPNIPENLADLFKITA
jgi:hypothetical protein